MFKMSLYTIYVRRYRFRPHRTILSQQLLRNPLRYALCQFLMCVVIVFMLWDIFFLSPYCGRFVSRWVCRSLGCVYLVLICVPCILYRELTSILQLFFLIINY
jgi:hypothetical protein